jgi:hypothetical protein
MKNLSTILITLFFSQLLQAQTTIQEPVWKTLESEDYSIQYPSTWELNESGMMGTKFIFLSQPDGETDDFRENVNLVVQSLQGQKITMDQFVQITKNQLEVMITDVNILFDERLEKDGMEYHRMIYTGSQGAFNLKLEQYYFLANDNVYVLTLTCKIIDFDEYAEIGEKIMGSFELR